MENCFCWIKNFRRIATRYDQAKSSNAAMVHVVIIWPGTGVIINAF